MEKITTSKKKEIIDQLISYLQDLRTCAVSRETETKVKVMAEPLDLDTILSISETIINTPISCDCYNSGGSVNRAWGELIFSKIKKEEDLEKTLSLSAISFRWETILKKAIEIKSKTFIVKALLEISDLGQVDFSVPLELMNDSEKENVFNNLLTTLEEKASLAFKKRCADYDRMKDDRMATYNNPYFGIYLEIGESCLDSRLKIIKIMLNQNIEIKDSAKRMAKISEHIKQIEVRPNSNYASARGSTNRIKEAFAEVSLRILPPDISGEGLETVNVNGQHISYLNGNLVGEMKNACNVCVEGDAVVWMETFELDRDVRSVQYKSSIFAWKKSWKKSKEIYERHAWTREGVLNVSFNFNGETVKILSTISEKSEEREEISLT